MADPFGSTELTRPRASVVVREIWSETGRLDFLGSVEEFKLEAGVMCSPGSRGSTQPPSTMTRAPNLARLDAPESRGRVCEPYALRDRGLLTAPSSARAQANGDAVDGQTLLHWVAELVDPPSRREPVVHPPLAGARDDAVEVA